MTPTFPPPLRPPPLPAAPAARPGVSRSRLSASFRRSPSRRALVEFTRNLAVMVSARLPLLEALAATARQTTDRPLRPILAQVERDVARGRSLSESLARHAAFSPLAVQLVKVGESTGLLGEVLTRLAEHQEKSDALRRQVRQALVYPAFVLAVALAATAFLLAVVVPIFAGLYADFDAELPGATRLVMGLSEGLVGRAPAILLAGLVGILLLRRLVATKRGRRVRDLVLLRLPAAGPLTRYALVARFSRTLSTLLENGVPLAEALDLLARSSGNVVLSEQIEHLLGAIRRGEPLAPSLPRSVLFPPVLVQLAAVGEATGRLGHVLAQAAAHYEAELEVRAQNLTTLLEPVLILTIGAILGGILVAMYLPLFDLVNVVGM